MNVPDLKKGYALDDLVGSVTPCAPFVASRCKTACPDPSGARPTLSKQQRRPAPAVDSAPSAERKPQNGSRRGAVKQPSTVPIFRRNWFSSSATGLNQIKNPCPPCKTFYKREATKLKEHAKDEQ